MSARERILERIREAGSGRDRVEHPGPFGGWRPEVAAAPVRRFDEMFTAAGGEVVVLDSHRAARAWIADFARMFATATLGVGVPQALAPDLPTADAATAELGVSSARGAIAETGSLILDARDGRRSQLLAPTHVVIVDAGAIHETLRDALLALRDDLPSAIGFHSGPSKSADIGQVMVRGVHGPGRVVALVVSA